MRIGVIGAQCTGKSSLIQELSKHPKFSSYFIAKSPTRELYTTYGMSFESASTELQLATLSLQTFNILSHFDILLDRTPIDNFSYMTYHMNKGNTDISTNCYNFIKNHTQSLLEYIDCFVFLRPEFPIVQDGVRCVDEEQQLSIDSLLPEILSLFKVPPYKVFFSIGSLPQRVEQIVGLL